MNVLLHLVGAVSLAEVTGAPESDVVETGTVLLTLMAVAMVWLASSVANLRNEIGALRDSLAVGVRPAPSGVAPAGPTAREVAAIAAAVHCVLGAGARVVAVVPPDASGQDWSREGRRQVFQSHQIR